VFDRAVTQAPSTRPSVATLFTSLYPSQHHVYLQPLDRAGAARTRAEAETDTLSEEFLTLAELLRAAGYRTAAIISNPWMDARFGFAQGFEHYEDGLAHWGAPGEAVTAAALDWLAGLRPDDRYFLYVHYIDSHRPYGRLERDEVGRLRHLTLATPRPLGSEGNELVRKVLKLTDGSSVMSAAARPSRELIARAYDRGVEDFDRAFGTLVDGLAAHPAWERTAVFVTSDHGEALFTRGYGNHGRGLFDDEAAIPLVARLPGIEADRPRVQCLVGLVDLLPTLCDYLGLETPAWAAGWSFLAAAGKPTSGLRYVVTEGVTGNPRHRSIRNRYFKLMYEPGGLPDGRDKTTPFALYDLRSDSAERYDRLDPHRRAPEFDDAFRVFEDALPDAVSAFATPQPTSAPLDATLDERLRDLGYVDE
jgi:arylsulfatase A-like enzyme